MIHLSRLLLNPDNRRAMLEAADAYEMHRTLSKAIAHHAADGETLPRLLFRVEPVTRRGQPVPVIVQTIVEPDWTALTVPEGYFAEPPRTKAGELSLREGQRLRFRLRANPTVRKKVEREFNSKGETRTKRVGLVGVDNQVNWLLRKGSQIGADIDPNSIIVQHSDYRRTRKVLAGQRRPVHLDVLFEGVLTVKHPNGFRASLHQGIGSAKAFGFGLMSVAPAG